ncbi:MAG TPA: putative glycolipid-binding domain-containing protein, partial [Ktedonobacterales bacterium]|nr:putative glycolipid-binding domain-containing protein [Ktedonobacterales bacterium]
MSGDKPDAQRETETVGPPKLASHVEWQRVDGDGEEEFDLYEFGVGAQWILHGSLDMPAADAAERWVRYMITCDANWRTRRVVLARAKTLFELRRFPEINPFFILSADGKGNWRAGVWGVGERERPDL